MGMPIIKKNYIKVDESIADLIESVALEEAAIAHILNAEGEKLQKVINSKCTNVKTILEVNESVDKMVTKITILEKELAGKLKDAKEILELEKSRRNRSNYEAFADFNSEDEAIRNYCRENDFRLEEELY